VDAMKVRDGGERSASRLGSFTSVPIEQSRSGHFGGGKNQYTDNLQQNCRQPSTLISRTEWMAVILRETNANKKG
jgi:hypothetical protein